MAFAQHAAKASEKVVLGIVINVALQWPIYVAQERGFFKEEGLDVEVIITGGSAQAALQLAGGSLNIAETGIPDLIRVAAAGAPVRIILSEVNTPPFRIFGQKNIKSPSDLKGKLVMIGGAKDVTRIYTEAVLEANGLKPSDYTFTFSGASPNRLAALVSGAADATILPAPFDFIAQSQGFTDLGSVQKYLRHFPFTVVGVHTEWAKSHKQAVVGFVRSELKGIAWLYDPKNKDEAIRILLKHTKTPPAMAPKIYDQYLVEWKAFAPDGRLTKEEYDTAVKAIVRMGDLQEPTPPMDRVVDPSYIDAVGSR
jgi:ABC-type nitrate/sulfonate/bicarbonate transport system substrate-binding protein